MPCLVGPLYLYFSQEMEAIHASCSTLRERQWFRFQSLIICPSSLSSAISSCVFFNF